MNIHCKYDELCKPQKLKNHPKNRNKHGQDQIERLTELYKYHGIRHPIIVSKRSNYIVAGHGRKLAAIRCGMEEFPVEYQDFASDEAEYAFLQADNAIALWAELDLAGINSDLGDLGPDFNIDMLGIKDFKLDPSEHDDFQGDPDEVPEDVPTKANLGDLFILGSHRLRCGDSTNPLDFDLLMNGVRADICFTSPPYNVGNNGKMNGHMVGKKYLSTKDDKTENEYLDFINGNLILCMSHASEVFYNIQLLGANKKVIIDLLQKQKETLKDIIYWVKDNASPHIEPGIMASYVEWIICLSTDNQSKKFHKTSAPRGSLKNIIRGPGNGQNEFSKIHSATFPLYLAEKIIQDFSVETMSVLDTFGGTGTTLIACEKTKRKCFMMELDPHYIDVIIARWQKFSDKKAIREDGVLWDNIEVKA